MSIDEIYSTITHITTTIQNSAKQAIPTYTPKPPFLCILPNIILQHKTSNSYQNTRNPYLKPILNSLSHKIKNLRNKWLSVLWQSKLVDAHSDPHKFWTIVRSAHSKHQRCGITKDTHIASPQEQAQILTNIITGTPSTASSRIILYSINCTLEDGLTIRNISSLITSHLFFVVT
jgi:hypothetical protein